MLTCVAEVTFPLTVISIHLHVYGEQQSLVGFTFLSFHLSAAHQVCLILPVFSCWLTESLIQLDYLHHVSDPYSAAFLLVNENRPVCWGLIIGYDETNKQTVTSQMAHRQRVLGVYHSYLLYIRVITKLYLHKIIFYAKVTSQDTLHCRDAMTPVNCVVAHVTFVYFWSQMCFQNFWHISPPTLIIFIYI